MKTLKMPLAARFILLSVVALLFGCASSPSARLPEFPKTKVETDCLSPSSAVAFESKLSATPNADALIAAVAPSLTARYFVGEGYLAAADGDRREAIRLFDLAVRFPDNDQPIDRVQWSYGWGMFALGDYACALARFEAARQASPDTIAWLPQTFAVVYWRLGERQRAVDWYAVAVQNSAACWVDPRSAAHCTRRWRPYEQRTLLEVTVAWRAQRFR